MTIKMTQFIKKTYFLMVGVTLSLTSLIGCQTQTIPTAPIAAKSPTPINTSSHAKEAIITDPNASIDPNAAQKLPKLSVDSLNRYEWQLVQWVDAYGNTAQVAQKPAFTMDVRPSSLIFGYDCQRYRLRHEGHQSVSYSASNIADITLDTCQSRKSGDALNIAIHLKRLFPDYGRGRFNLALLPARSPSSKTLRGQSPLPRLAINVNDSQLVFTGTLKPIKPTLGLPITYKLLERYGWRLITATDSEGNPIPELGYKDLPIIAHFQTFPDNHGRFVGFDTACNGIGGSYVLTPNHELLIGAAPQTMMGCDDKRESVENKTRALELLSKSQLVLTKTAPNNNQKNKADYRLIQKIDSGDTLTWQSETKNQR